jgi:hypothetical protein
LQLARFVSIKSLKAILGEQISDNSVSDKKQNEKADIKSAFLFLLKRDYFYVESTKAI